MSAPVYDPSMGLVDYDPKGEEVVIAGKPRKGIVCARPALVEIYEDWDRKVATPPYQFMDAHLAKEDFKEAKAA